MQFFDEVKGHFGAALPIPCHRALTSAIAPWWYSTGLPLIHYGQKLAMQFFPRDGHWLARLQVFDSARHFRIPSLLNRFIRTLKSVEEGVG